MRHSRCLIAGLALGAAACAKPAPQPAGPNVVTITAADYVFNVPDTIPAGLTTFRLVNQGKELHHASLIRLKDGKVLTDERLSQRNGELLPVQGEAATS